MKKLSDIFKIAALTSAISVSSAQAAPYIYIKNSKGDDITVDCGKLILAPNKRGEKSINMSCDFAEQLNPDGKNLCSYTDKIPKTLSSPLSYKQEKATLRATAFSVAHFNGAHQDCITMSAGFAFRAVVFTSLKQGMGKEEANIKAAEKINRIYTDKHGANWREKKSCTLKVAVKACKAEMGLD